VTSHPSLATQLILRVLGLTLALSLATGATLLSLFQATVDDLRDRSLQGQAADIASHIDALPGTRPLVLLPPALAENYGQANGEFVFALLDSRGTVLQGSEGVSARLGPLPRQEEAGLFETPRGGRHFYGASLPVRLDGELYWVQVAQGPSHDNVLDDGLAEAVFRRGGWALPPFLLLVLGMIAWTIRRGLRPLREASDMAAHISPANLDVRLPVAGIPREVMPLVAAVNNALERLAEGFRQQRQFTADAAHELRTPLAVLRANLDRFAGQEWLPGVLVDVDRMGRLVQQLLDSSRLERAATAAQPVDLREMALEVSSALAPAAMAQGREIELRDSGANRVEGDPDALYAAIRNLVENAIEHTPAGTTVVVDVRRPGTVQVRDHGPGIPEADRADIFRRFWRPAHRRGKPGAGLGLSIVAEVARRHGGTVDFAPVPDGGCQFTLALPPRAGSDRGAGPVPAPGRTATHPPRPAGAVSS
jgi:signal transduction histidine kinase